MRRVGRREPELRDRLPPLAAPEQEQAEMEANDRRAREDACERAEAAERITPLPLAGEGARGAGG